MIKNIFIPLGLPPVFLSSVAHAEHVPEILVDGPQGVHRVPAHEEGEEVVRVTCTIILMKVIEVVRVTLVNTLGDNIPFRCAVEKSGFQLGKTVQILFPIFQFVPLLTKLFSCLSSIYIAEGKNI